jgi:hypothetical protein
MLRLARNILGLFAALLLMGVLATVAFVLSRSNPGIHAGVFFGAAGVLYTLTLLFAMNR